MRKATSRAQPYVLGISVAGCLVIAASILELRAAPPGSHWWLLVALTLVSGSAVLKLPATAINFSISDVFTLTAAVVFGPAAGTVIVAIDSLVISSRLVRTDLPVQRILFNCAAPPVAMWISANAVFWMSGLERHNLADPPFEVIGPWLLVFAGVYFIMSTFVVATAIALHERVSILGIWRAHFQSLWVTFIGGALGAGCVVFAMQLGTYGLAVLSLPLLLALILHFAYRNATGRVADQLHHLAEVNRLHLSTVEALAHAIDAKDTVTHGHIRRVQNLAALVAARLGVTDQLELRAIEAAALLHDIGKLAIPDHILNKPGKLSPAEFDRMKTHAAVGAEILSQVQFPYPVVPIVRHHHENWDGTGYPDGLKGEAIPIGARILSVVDCYDALTSDRPYRRALTPSAAFEIIDERRGTMYDPRIVDTFREICMNEGHELAMRQVSSPTPVPEPTAAAEPVRRDLGEECAAALAVGAALARSRFETWDAVAHALCHLPAVSACVVFAVDDERQCLRACAAAGLHSSALEAITIPLGERMSGWVAATQQPVINADAALDLFDAQADLLRAGAAVPCAAGERRLVVALYSTTASPFSLGHRSVVEAAVAFAVTPAAPVEATVVHRAFRRPARMRHLERVLTQAPGEEHPRVASARGRMRNELRLPV